jgi:sialate O-acetylesterase
MARSLMAAVALGALLPAVAQAAPRLLDPMFADHAVVQRDRPIPVWGEAAPGAKVDVSLGPDHATATARPDGHWRAELAPMAAGGPYPLSAHSEADALTVNDVLVGDVFMCSGQSNMEFPLIASVNGRDDIAHSADEGLRLLTIPQYSSAIPLARLPQPAAWKVAGPDSSGRFSAVCFFMAQTLRAERKDVPIGLINNSWGGAAISASLKPPAFVATGGDARIASIVSLFGKDGFAANRQWGDIWESWWRAHEKDPAEAAPWAADFTPDASWKPVPSLDHWVAWHIPALHDFVGLMWYRTTVTLTPAQAAKGGTLLMGPVDDLDQTWVNGHPVGTGWGSPQRRYPLAPGMLVAGKNVIVVNDFNTWADGGIWGPADTRAIELADGSRVPLDGQWLYRQVTEFKDQPPRAPWDAIAGVGTIQNGMVTPMGPYGLKGAIWYQGASDAPTRLAYAPKVRALIAQWRADFGKNLPVVVVQLPNFGPLKTPPADSDWAGLREAQRRAVAGDPHAALVVTIDLGEPDNLHPRKKRPVGARVARAMDHIAYGAKLSASGPAPIAAKREGKAIVVSFAGLDGKLQAEGGEAAPFELCGDSDKSCHVVPAQVEGNRITLAADASATRVRYCWADSPTCTVHDASLPATPFELAIR